MRKLLLILLMLLLPTICLSCVFSKENEQKNWQTYADKVFNFTIQYPVNWRIEFWKHGKDVKSLPSQNFGRLADYPNESVIYFNVYEVEEGDSLEHFISVSKPDRLFFKETKKLGKATAIRTGVHWYLEDGESYELRQSMIIDGYFLDLTAGLPQESIEKKDDKYKLILEIMDTFKKL